MPTMTAMTTTETTPAHIFTDAQQMYDSALERLAAGDIRDAADKAWCATLRATDALVLARTGQQPPTSPATTRAFLVIGESDPAVRRLQGRYFQRQSVLHGNCFYMGLCEPVEATTRLIRETDAYIRDTQALSES